jgi:hypothetical protein
MPSGDTTHPGDPLSEKKEMKIVLAFLAGVVGVSRMNVLAYRGAKT